MTKYSQKEYFEILRQKPETIYERLIRNGNDRSDEDIEIVLSNMNACRDYDTCKYGKVEHMISLVERLIKAVKELNPEVTDEQIDEYQKEATKIIEQPLDNEENVQDYLTMLENIQSYTHANRSTNQALARTVYRMNGYIESVTSSVIVRNYISIVNSGLAKGIKCGCEDYFERKNFYIEHCKDEYHRRTPEFIQVTSSYKEPESIKPITIKIYASIKKEKISEVMTALMALADERKIPIYYKTRPYETNDMLTIRLESLNHLEEIVSFLKSNPHISTENHPFMPLFDNVGITFDKGGSYNNFIAENISEFLKNNPTGTYEEFIAYLESKSKNSTTEDKLFMKNIYLSQQANLSLEDFKKAYTNEVQRLEYEAAKETIKKALINRMPIYPTPQEVIQKVHKTIEEFAIKYNLTDKTPEEIINDLFGYSSIEEFVEDSYHKILESYNNGRSSRGYCEACHYYSKTQAEKWYNESGAAYASSGVRAFKLLYEDNQASNRYKNAKLKYGQDYEEFMAKTFGEIEYDFFKSLANSHIESLKPEENQQSMSKK